MPGKTNTWIGVVLTILSFIIGLAGAVMLFLTGETNDAFLAFAVVSFPFMLFAGFFSWLAPYVRWRITIIMLVPITVLAILAELSGNALLLFTLMTILLTVLSASLGAWLKTR